METIPFPFSPHPYESLSILDKTFKYTSMGSGSSYTLSISFHQLTMAKINTQGDNDYEIFGLYGILTKKMCFWSPGPNST